MKENKHTKGEWTISKNGDITGDSHPICTVEYGVWGDTFPTLKLEGLTLDRKCVAVMEMIEYGEIPIEESEANSRLIASAPDLLEACIEFIRKVESGEAKSTRSYKQMKEAVSKALGE